MSEWISVEDRLPEQNVRVLAWYDGVAAHSDALWDRSGAWFAAKWRDGWNQPLYTQAKQILDFDSSDITHWIPLPEPPERVLEGQNL